jgi:hypothetical protein
MVIPKKDKIGKIMNIKRVRKIAKNDKIWVNFFILKSMKYDNYLS